MPGLGYRHTRTVIVLVFGFWDFYFRIGRGAIVLPDHCCAPVQASAMPSVEYCAQYFFGHRLVCPYFFA